jgi:hypothetical protein
MPRVTNAALVANLRRFANFEGGTFVLPDHLPTDTAVDTAAILEATRMYRERWLMPVIDEIEKRLVRTKE